MRLNLSAIIEMPGGSLPFECELETDALDFPSVKAYPSKPHAEGRVYNEAGVLHLEGTLTAEMTCICDRCGAEFDSVKALPLEATIVEEESEEFPELFVLDGNAVDLDEILETSLILDMETKFLCREDCKGLCAVCGANLNLGPCACRKPIDPRFAVLEQLLDKEK